MSTEYVVRLFLYILFYFIMQLMSMKRSPAAILAYDDAFEKNYASFRSEQVGRRFVLVGGCFDILHIGHVRFLEEAARQGDIVVLSLESDAFIQAAKHRTPVHDQMMRATILSACRYVDLIVALPHLTSHDEYDAMVRAIAPDVIAITGADPGQVHKERQAQMLGIEVVPVVNLITNYSTTKILDEIISRD